MKKSTKIRVLCALLLGIGPAFGAENPESYRFEVTSSIWRMNTDGTIRADSTPINLLSDLGVTQRRLTFDGKVVLQLKRRQRFVVEGLPINIRGLNTINRTVDYFGQTFSVSDTLKTNAQMNYVYAGYHHDWISNSMGHFGTSIGGAYLGLAGSIQGTVSGIDKSKSAPFGLPLAGLDARVFPIPGKPWLEVEGVLRGLPAGSYGHWVEGSASAGARVGPIGFLIGYRELLVNFHQTGVAGNGLALRMRGPMATVLWSW